MVIFAIQLQGYIRVHCYVMATRHCQFYNIYIQKHTGANYCKYVLITLGYRSIECTPRECTAVNILE